MKGVGIVPLLLCVAGAAGAQQHTASVPEMAARFAALDARGRLVTSAEPRPGMREFNPHVRQRRITTVTSAGHALTGPWMRGRAQWAVLIEQAAADAGLDPALVDAVVRVESGYDRNARSPAGAYGLMQVMPATAARFGVSDLNEPRENLRAGTAYLAWLLRRFNGDHMLALAAYNAGEGAVIRHGNAVPPYAETQAYVARLRGLYRFP